MAQASAAIDIPAPPDQVWQLIGGFGSLPDWLPYIARSEPCGSGRIRSPPRPTLAQSWWRRRCASIEIPNALSDRVSH